MMGGNASSADSRNTISVPRLKTSWQEMVHRRKQGKGDVSLTNGLFETKTGELVPEEIMEVLLSYVEVEDILSVSKVCQLWKRISTNLSFWKQVYAKQGQEWAHIPSHLKEKPNSWIALYSICKNNLLQRNFVTNHSGEPNSQNQLRGWSIGRNGGSRIRVERRAVGCDPLPTDDFFNNSSSCIVTSYQTCELIYGIELWRMGLNPSVMKLLLPFTIEFTQMVGVRFDCGGLGSCGLSTSSKAGDSVFHTEVKFSHASGSNWSKVKTTLFFGADVQEELLEKTYRLLVTLNGRDNQFWNGHYGPKFARTGVTLKLIHNPTQFSLDANDTGAVVYHWNCLS